MLIWDDFSNSSAETVWILMCLSKNTINYKVQTIAIILEAMTLVN